MMVVIFRGKLPRKELPCYAITTRRYLAIYIEYSILIDLLRSSVAKVALRVSLRLEPSGFYQMLQLILILNRHFIVIVISAFYCKRIKKNVFHDLS